MNNVRTFLYLALAVVIFMLWNAWEMDHSSKIQPHTTASSQQQVHKSTQTTIPTTVKASTTSSPSATQTTQLPNANKASIISVKTDVLTVKIDSQNGTILQTSLPKYPKTEKNPNVPVTMLTDNPDKTYIAQSGLMDKNGKPIAIIYHSAQQHYVMGKDQNKLIVTLSGKTSNGLLVTKQFILQRNHYDIKVNTIIKNNSDATWQGSVFAQFTRKWPIKKAKTHSGSFAFLQDMTTYTGTAISTKSDIYDKYSFSDLKDQNIDTTSMGGWTAMIEQYFLTAWVPEKNQENHYYSRVDNNLYTLGSYSPLLTIAPGKQIKQQNQLYVGPKVMSTLKKIAPGLDQTIDYGWLWFIAILIFWLMQKIYEVIGNWGWSIILVTIIIKLIFYKLSATSYRSMAKMRNLQPKLSALKERFGSDKQAFSKAMMELYKQEKVNPLGGCLPIAIQIPVFIALYWVLLESVQLRQAPFIFWIQNLAAPDPYYVLPILMGITMFFQQKLSPAPPDPMQAKLMMILPVVFTLLFLNMPAGLMLYWVANNSISILQQWYIMRSVNGKSTKPNKPQQKQKKNRWLSLVKNN